VATPGRLLDHFQYPYATLPELEVLVLDEADRMLDMGFLPDIRRVIRHLPDRPRQTLFFSATMPPPIAELAKEMLQSPATVRVQKKQAPAKGITQALYPVPAELKVALLVDLIRRGEIGSAIAFCRTKHRANRLAQKLEEHGIPVARIHGNRSQAQRTDALAGFKNGRYRVLAATDVVARGIDVEALDHVVNFDVPAAAEDYIHRVGRTARAEATGEAYTFVSPEEEGAVREIERALGRRIERRVSDRFDYTVRAKERFEVPLGERIAAIRAVKSEQRARARANAERKAAALASGSGSSTAGKRGPRTGSGAPFPNGGDERGAGTVRPRENGGRRRRRGGRRSAS
jgi:ATP-dependent RNA helicase RhlE